MLQSRPRLCDVFKVKTENFCCVSDVRFHDNGAQSRWKHKFLIHCMNQHLCSFWFMTVQQCCWSHDDKCLSSKCNFNSYGTNQTILQKFFVIKYLHTYTKKYILWYKFCQLDWDAAINCVSCTTFHKEQMYLLSEHPYWWHTSGERLHYWSTKTFITLVLITHNYYTEC